jgi:hypothetical protein
MGRSEYGNPGDDGEDQGWSRKPQSSRHSVAAILADILVEQLLHHRNSSDGEHGKPLISPSQPALLLTDRGGPQRPSTTRRTR